MGRGTSEPFPWPLAAGSAGRPPFLFFSCGKVYKVLLWKESRASEAWWTVLWDGTTRDTRMCIN